MDCKFCGALNPLASIARRAWRSVRRRTRNATEAVGEVPATPTNVSETQEESELMASDAVLMEEKYEVEVALNFARAQAAEDEIVAGATAAAAAIVASSEAAAEAERFTRSEASASGTISDAEDTAAARIAEVETAASEMVLYAEAAAVATVTRAETIAAEMVRQAEVAVAEIATEEVARYMAATVEVASRSAAYAEAEVSAAAEAPLPVRAVGSVEAASETAMGEEAEAATGEAAATIATLMATVADRDNEISAAAAKKAACVGHLDRLVEQVDAALAWQCAAVDEAASLREQLATAEEFRRDAEIRFLDLSHDTEANNILAVTWPPPAHNVFKPTVHAVKRAHIAITRSCENHKTFAIDCQSFGSFRLPH